MVVVVMVLGLVVYQETEQLTQVVVAADIVLE